MPLSNKRRGANLDILQTNAPPLLRRLISLEKEDFDQLVISKVLMYCNSYTVQGYLNYCHDIFQNFKLTDTFEDVC